MIEEKGIKERIDVLKRVSEVLDESPIDMFIETKKNTVRDANLQDSNVRKNLIKDFMQDEFKKITKSDGLNKYLKLYDYETHYAIAFVDPMQNNLLEIGVIPPTEIYPRPKDGLEKVILSYRSHSTEIYDTFKDAISVFKENAIEFKNHLDNFKKPAYQNIEEVKLKANSKYNF